MNDYGLQRGTADIGSAGPITFGPDGILFLADNVVGEGVRGRRRRSRPGRRVRALRPRERRRPGRVVPRLRRRRRRHPGHGGAPDVAQRVPVGAARPGRRAAVPVLVRIDRLDGSITDVALDDVPVAEVTIADAPSEDDERVDVTLPRGAEGEELQIGERTIRILRRPIRTSTVTDMAYVDGALLVAGLSNEEFSSKLRRIPFPFRDEVSDNNLEIFHVSHGQWETAAPIRTFVPYEGGRSILASYTCTPVVHFPLATSPRGPRRWGARSPSSAR